MQFKELEIKGVYLVTVKRIEDERGFFGRAFCADEFAALGLPTNMVQVNVSSNKLKGTLRGLHMQLPPDEEAKLVRCTKGAIFDVAVDLRPGSETFGKWVGVTLDSVSFDMLYVPPGFAHGYLTLEDHTDVTYQVSAYYAPQSERGIRWDDPYLNIQWPIEPVLISVKDQNQPFLNINPSLPE